MHVSGLLALNPGPIDKNNSTEVLPKHMRQKRIAHVCTSLPITAPAQEAISIMRTFPITAPAQEAISAAASTGQQAPGDTVMNDTESESVGAEPMEEISTGGTSSVAPNQVCVVLISWY